jgi:hypothetical protein
MSVTAQQLSKSGARGKDLDAVVQEQLRIIDDRLLRAERCWGRNVVRYDLPQTLSLPGLEKKDGQRLMYSMIIKSLESRGFEVRILLETDDSVLFIAWMTDLDKKEVEAMNALIRAKRIYQADVKKFIAHGAVEAPRSATATRHGRAEPAEPMTVLGAGQVMRPRGGLGTADNAEVRAAPARLTTAEAELLGD